MAMLLRATPTTVHEVKVGFQRLKRPERTPPPDLSSAEIG